LLSRYRESANAESFSRNTPIRSLGTESECCNPATPVALAAYFRDAIEDLMKKYEEPKKGKK